MLEDYLCSLIVLESKCKINEALCSEVEAEMVSAERRGCFVLPPHIEMCADPKTLTSPCLALRKIVPHQLRMQDKKYKGLQMSSESLGKRSAQ